MKYENEVNDTKKIGMIQFYDQSILKVDGDFRFKNVPLENVEIFTKFIDNYDSTIFNLDNFIEEHYKEIYNKCISDVVVLNVFSLEIESTKEDLKIKEIRDFFKENFFKNPTPVKSEGVYSFSTHRPIIMLNN